jgi:hypothetical protein
VNEWEKLLTILIFTLVATLGGAVNYLKTTKDFLYSQFFIEASASGIVGLLVTLVCLSFGIDQYLTGAIAGVAGFLGADTVKSIFAKFFKDKTGYDIKDDDDKIKP